MNSIEEIIQDVAVGRPVVMRDDCRREDEGDLIVGAEKITPELISFMVFKGGGLICISMEGERLDELDIPLMRSLNTQPAASFLTSFCYSVDAAESVKTGISAFDRVETIRRLLYGKKGDLVSPGHMFPLRARPGGVLERPGHTEASCDLARLAGLYPSGVLCEIMSPDGHMLRSTGLEDYAREHNLKMSTIEDLIEYRRKTRK